MGQSKFLYVNAVTLFLLLFSCVSIPEPEFVVSTSPPVEQNMVEKVTTQISPTNTPDLSSTPLLTTTPTLIPPTPLPTNTPTLIPSPQPQVITIENLVDLELTRSIGTGKLVDFDWTNDNEELYVSSSMGIYVFEGQTLEFKEVIAEGRWIDSLAISPDDELLAFSEKHLLTIWDIENGKVLTEIKIPESSGWHLGFSHDSQLLASGGNYPSLFTWEVSTGKKLYQFDVDQGISSQVTGLAFSKDDKFLLSGHPESGIRVWDLDTGQLVKTLQGQPEAAMYLTFSEDGQLLAAGYRNNTIRVWTTKNWQLINVLVGEGEIVESLAFTDNGSRLIAGYSNNYNAIWDLAGGKEERLTQLEGKIITVSPNSSRILTLIDDTPERLCLWDFGNLRYINDFSINAEKYQGFSSINEIELSPNDSLISLIDISEDDILDLLRGNDSTGSSSIVVLQAPTGKFSYQIGGLLLPGNLTISTDSKLIAASSGLVPSEEIFIWDAESGELLQSIETVFKVTDLTFSPDSRTIAISYWESAPSIWDVETGDLVSQFTGFIPSNNRIGFIEYSTDGSILYTIGRTGAIGFWDMKSGTRLNNMDMGYFAVGYCQFLANPETVVCRNDDGDTIRFVNLEKKTIDQELFIKEVRSDWSSWFWLSPDRQWLLIDTYDWFMLDLTAGNTTPTYFLPEYRRGLRNPVFSNDGKTLILVRSDDVIEFWQVLD